MVAIGVVAVPSVRASPFLNDLTSSTVVFASGLNAVFIVSSQVSATGAGAGAGAGAALSSSPLQPATSTAASENKEATRARAALRGERSGIIEVSCAQALGEGERFVVQLR